MNIVLPLPKVPLIKTPRHSFEVMALEISRTSQWRPMNIGSASWCGTSKNKGFSGSCAVCRYCANLTLGSIGELSWTVLADLLVVDFRVLNCPNSSKPSSWFWFPKKKVEEFVKIFVYKPLKYVCKNSAILIHFLPVNECLRSIEFEDALLCSDIDTDSKDPIDSHPRFETWDFSCIDPRDMSASDELVKVDRGLVLFDPSEHNDCLCFVRFCTWLFSRKSPSRACSSSSRIVFDCDVLMFPLSSSVEWETINYKELGKKSTIFTRFFQQKHVKFQNEMSLLFIKKGICSIWQVSVEIACK